MNPTCLKWDDRRRGNDFHAAGAVRPEGFAVNHPTSLDNIQRYPRHVRHLIDPDAELNRPIPGREYGVAKAARTMLDRLASGSAELDQAARHTIEEVLRHTLRLSDQIVANCAQVITASYADEAIVPARANKALLEIMRNGGQDNGSRPGLTQLKSTLNAPD